MYIYIYYTSYIYTYTYIHEHIYIHPYLYSLGGPGSGLRAGDPLVERG